VIALQAQSTVAAALRDSGLPRREAGLLLCSVLGCERQHLIVHGDEELDSSKLRRARDVFARRRAGEPVAYITGRREFYGVELRVTPDVLIPRPETELLVELALERAAPGARVLDLGTGSGAIAVALACERPDLAIVATDISEAALAVARRNAQENGAAIEFTRSDWFEGLGPERFDLVVSNPPYVAADDPHLDQGDVRFEPGLALVGGEDGLDCIGRIIGRAQGHLRSGGWLLLEHGYDQGGRCIDFLREFGYLETRGFVDLAGLPRVCAGRAAAPTQKT
jgi:release factor glutamine methyltransferase